MIKRIIYSVGVMAMIITSARAQDNRESKFHIMAMPQYLIKNGLRFDIDYKVGDGRWLIISPYLYLVDNSSVYDSSMYVQSVFYQPEFVKLTGYGLGLAQRHVLNRQGSVRTSVYMEYGLLCRYYSFEMDDYLWTTYTENNLNFMRRERAEYDIKVTNLGINCQFGLQHEIFDNFLIDVFVGCGMRYSIYDKPEGSSVKFNNSIFDYGFTGTMVTGGIRLGVAL